MDYNPGLPRTKLLRHVNAIFQSRAMPPSCPKGTNSPLPTPGAMLFCLNSLSVHFLRYRKQQCNGRGGGVEGGGGRSFNLRESIFVRASAKNRYFCNMSQQVLSEVIPSHPGMEEGEVKILLIA